MSYTGASVRIIKPQIEVLLEGQIIMISRLRSLHKSITHQQSELQKLQCLIQEQQIVYRHTNYVSTQSVNKLESLEHYHYKGEPPTPAFYNRYQNLSIKDDKAEENWQEEQKSEQLPMLIQKSQGNSGKYILAPNPKFNKYITNKESLVKRRATAKLKIEKQLASMRETLSEIKFQVQENKAQFESEFNFLVNYFKIKDRMHTQSVQSQRRLFRSNQAKLGNIPCKQNKECSPKGNKQQSIKNKSIQDSVSHSDCLKLQKLMKEFPEIGSIIPQQLCPQTFQGIIVQEAEEQEEQCSQQQEIQSYQQQSNNPDICLFQQQIQHNQKLDQSQKFWNNFMTKLTNLHLGKAKSDPQCYEVEQSQKQISPQNPQRKHLTIAKQPLKQTLIVSSDNLQWRRQNLGQGNYQYNLKLPKEDPSQTQNRHKNSSQSQTLPKRGNQERNKSVQKIDNIQKKLEKQFPCEQTNKMIVKTKTGARNSNLSNHRKPIGLSSVRSSCFNSVEEKEEVFEAEETDNKEIRNRSMNSSILQREDRTQSNSQKTLNIAQRLQEFRRGLKLDKGISRFGIYLK